MWQRGGVTHDSTEMMQLDRHLKVTPVDMRQARFKPTLRGFDRQEVVAFMVEAADSYEEALRECERLRSDNLRLHTLNEQYREYEHTLRNTLVSAQRVADDLRAAATKDAANIAREASARAERTIQDARVTLKEIQREIAGLRLKQQEAETRVEATISALRHSLEYVRDPDRGHSSVGPRRLLIEATALPA